MREVPPEVPESELRSHLDRYWDIAAVAIRYVPLGFGSHHWDVTGQDGRRWFVTVDDHRSGRLGIAPEESLPGLERAMATARVLREAGLPFVVAPVPDGEGKVVRPLGEDGFSILVLPWLDAVALGEGSYASDDDRAAVIAMVAAIHRATGSIATLPNRDSLEVYRRHQLEAALADLDMPWRAGPYAERAWELARRERDGILAALAFYDDLAERVRSGSDDWVITHGEPHPANVVRDAAGSLYLVDWDTCLLGPPERDLWMLARREHPADLAPYTARTGVDSVSAAAVRLFRLRWDLSEIAEYLTWFRNPHRESPDSAIAWEELRDYLPLEPSYLEPVPD